MKNSNTLIIIVSVIVGVAAAIAATLVVLKVVRDKKSKLEATNYVFENEFEEAEAEEIEE